MKNTDIPLDFNFLKNIDYCIIHGWQDLPNYLRSDLDIVLRADGLEILEKNLLTLNNARLVQLLQHESTGFCFVLSAMKRRKLSFIQIDAATDYRRNGFIWFTAEQLLYEKRAWKDFYISAPSAEFQYLIIKKILKKEFNESSKTRLHALVAELQNESAELVQNILSKKWGKRVIDCIRLEKWEYFERSSTFLKRFICIKRLLHNPMSFIKYWPPEFRRIWHRYWNPTGLFVAVLGCDGSGKSTLIANLCEQSSGVFRQSRYYHFKPNIILAKKKSIVVTSPHEKKNRSWLASSIKIFLYCFDFIIGYWKEIYLGLVRSTLVIFDRYYYDVFVDPKRYRYGGSFSFIRSLELIIPKPHIVFVLDTSEEHFVARKNEILLEELKRQRQAYQSLSFSLPNCYLLNSSLPINEVTNHAQMIMLDFLHARYLSRRRSWFTQERYKNLDWIANILKIEISSIKKGQKFYCLSLSDGRTFLFQWRQRNTAIESLSVYSSHRKRAKIFKHVLSFGLRIGISQKVLPSIYLNGLENYQIFLSSLFNCSDVEIAMSLGTPGKHRKPVFKVLSPDGNSIGYVKIAYNKVTNSLLMNEAKTIQRLSKTSNSFLVPEILFYGDYNGHLILVEEACRNGITEATSTLSEQFITALCELAQHKPIIQAFNESNFSKKISNQIRQIDHPYYKNLLHNYITDFEQRNQCYLHFCLAHGDLVPWNAYYSNTKLYIFDWEYAFDGAPAGYDIFHFIIQQNMLVKKSDPIKTYKDIITNLMAEPIKHYWQCNNIKNLPLYLFLYLIDRLTTSLIDEPENVSRIHFLSQLIQLIQRKDNEKT